MVDLLNCHGLFYIKDNTNSQAWYPVKMILRCWQIYFQRHINLSKYLSSFYVHWAWKLYLVVKEIMWNNGLYHYIWWEKAGAFHRKYKTYSVHHCQKRLRKGFYSFLKISSSIQLFTFCGGNDRITNATLYINTHTHTHKAKLHRVFNCKGNLFIIFNILCVQF